MNAKKLLLCLLLLSCAVASAQETGQICIQSFEDRDGSGTRDENEPPITHGIGANLLSALSVTIDTQLLEYSVTAARGLTCFDNLPAGDYLVVLTSAQFEATNSASFSALVVPGTAPVLYDLGLAPIQIERVAGSSAEGFSSEAETRALQGIAIAVVGSAIAAGVVFLFGLSLYFGVFRRRLRRIRQAQLEQIPRPAPQPAPLSSAEQTPLGPPVTAAPPNDPFNLHRGSPQLFDENDTNPLGHA